VPKASWSAGHDGSRCALNVRCLTRSRRCYRKDGLQLAPCDAPPDVRP
jgi:hypothetical protein